MKNILTIIKKELSRIFKDPRLIIMTFIFPGLMIYGMYSLVGSTLQSKANEVQTVYVVNIPNDYKDIINLVDENIVVEEKMNSDVEVINEQIKSNKALLLLVFDDNFKEKALNKQKPELKIYYNPANQQSSDIISKIDICNNTYKSMVLEESYGDGTIFKIKEEFVMEEEKAIASIIAQLLPFLIITFLYQGAMSVAPESIAGEKERGTMATLLATPVKRSEIALGKVISLSILATLSAISSFIGIILSIPKLMGLSGQTTNIYGFSDYLIVLMVLIVTVLVLIVLISIISAYAKNTKEASVLVLPLMLISMGIGISSMLGNSSSLPSVTYLIPIFNSVQMLSQIFTFEINFTQLLITIFSNITYTLILIFLLTKMFNSEKIMFSK